MSDEPSIFTRIIRGELPCHKVHETESTLAFLDIMPSAEGHTLVVPKCEVPLLEDLSAEDFAALAASVQTVTRGLKAVLGFEGCNILVNNGPVAGQVVPHVHFHIIPRAEGDGLRLNSPHPQADPAALAELAERIAAAI